VGRAGGRGGGAGSQPRALALSPLFQARTSGERPKKRNNNNSSFRRSNEFFLHPRTSGGGGEIAFSMSEGARRASIKDEGDAGDAEEEGREEGERPESKQASELSASKQASPACGVSVVDGGGGGGNPFSNLPTLRWQCRRRKKDPHRTRSRRFVCVVRYSRSTDLVVVWSPFICEFAANAFPSLARPFCAGAHTTATL